MSRHDASSSLAASDPQALRAEIERTRTLLGETVGALAAKMDVKARARSAVGEAASGVRHQLHGAGRTVTRGLGGRARTTGWRIVAAPGPRVALLGGATALTALLVTVIVRRRR